QFQQTSSVVESDICGRDADKKMIINWLTSDTDNMLSILSIVGMGGLGKTMLAQLVYNDPRIEGKFIVKAWVCVSEEFDVLNVSRAILDTFTKSTENSDWLEIVHTKLKDKLRGNRFLLVLDDVWNESRPKWEVVQNALVCGAQGSRILVTTRSQKVASTMRSEQHHLQQLQEDYCWKLFAKHAFHDDNPQPNPGYNEIGMKIVEKCGGLPLALKSIGSLLQNKSFVSDWENILKSEIWEIEDSDIVPALAVSYHHLPPHLKTCFAYYTLFPKDYEFDKECLIQLWMAENFLHCHQGSKSPEEVGQQYFNDLLSRSFFQQSSENKEVFVMHDVLNDLGKYVCGDIYFRLEVDQAKCTQKTARYFSVAMNNKQHFDEFGTLCDTKRLRTFMPTIRIMNEYYNSWHCNMSIPELFSKFKFLRLNYCRYLKEQPSNLHELTNLHRLEFVNTKIIKVPPHLGKLKNLQVSMSSFDVGKTSEFTIQQLGELNLHGRLSFWELQNIENPSDALAADLKNKTRLVELELEWNWNRNPDDSAKERDAIVIENLQPSKHLEKLSIRNYGGKQFPNWLSNNSLSNVVFLKLHNYFKSSLDGIVSIGADFHGNGTSSFPSLETLKFSSMKAWEKWECEAVIGAFPCLQYLSISKCPKLKGDLPEQLLPLKKLQISECKQLEASAPRALELDLKDFGKLQLDRASLKKLRMGGHSAETDNGFDSQKTFPLDFFPALRTLHLRGFHNLQMITQDHTHNHLEFLKIRECPQLESLPGSMHMLLPSLKELVIDDCPRVESFPEGGLPSNLKEMGLYKCSSGLMASLKGALGGNPSLESLGIVELDAESFPDEGLLPLSLTCLRIRDFRNLKKLDYKGLCQLSSLKKLILGNCPNLQQLPEEGLSKSISYLFIGGCPKLEQRCQNPGGEDWPKI
ncbi:putative disease resistance RPP13-like protein 1, partial [Glycine soja]